MLAYLENRYKLGEELSKVKKAVPYQCIIIGKSGAGKSTLLNWLNGTKYEEKRSASGNRYLAVLAGSEPGIVQTGDATKSETVLPNVLTVGSNIMVDCPGFFDTRERIVNIGNALNIKQIVTGNVKVLVVVNVNNLYGDRGHFEELLKLRDIFGQGFLNTGSYLIILNKGNEYTYDECISRIEEIMSGQEAYAPIREFMGHIINRIRKVNLLDGESESQYLEVKEPNQYILNAELSHMPRYSGEINVALDPEDQEQVKQMTQGLIGAVKKELLNEGRINHEIILLNYGMLVRLQGLLDNTMRIVDKKISSSFISIQRKITRLVGAGNYVKARELLACLEQLRSALQTDEIGRLFIGKINVVKYYRESREELDKAQAAQNEIEDRKKEVAILRQQQEAEQRERARLEADIKALKEKGTLNDGEVKTLRQKVDQLQKKLIDMVPSGGVVTRDEYARTNALLENAQRELKRLNDERGAKRNHDTPIAVKKPQESHKPSKDTIKAMRPNVINMETIDVNTSHRCISETCSALMPLGDLYTKTDYEIRFILEELQTRSHSEMMRYGRQRVPTDLSQVPFNSCHFNSSFMKKDKLCPAQIYMMKYIDPRLYSRLPANYSEVNFDGDKWYRQTKNDTGENARNTLVFLGKYFNKSSLIKDQLSQWSIMILGHKVEISFCISEQSSEGARFLQRIFKNARFVEIHYLEQSFGTAVDKETKSKAAELRGLETRMRELSEAAAEAESKAEVRGAKERVSQANNDGQTPLLVATHKDHTEIVKILRAAQNTQSAAAAAGGVEESKGNDQAQTSETSMTYKFFHTATNQPRIQAGRANHWGRSKHIKGNLPKAIENLGDLITVSTDGPPNTVKIDQDKFSEALTSATTTLASCIESNPTPPTIYPNENLSISLSKIGRFLGRHWQAIEKSGSENKGTIAVCLKQLEDITSAIGLIVAFSEDKGKQGTQVSLNANSNTYLQGFDGHWDRQDVKVSSWSGQIKCVANKQDKATKGLQAWGKYFADFRARHTADRSTSGNENRKRTLKNLFSRSSR